MVDNQKTQQMIAFFVDKAQSALTQAHLMSLLYLSDRQGLRSHRDTISGDILAATPAYPVLFDTMMKMIDGGGRQGWGDLIYEGNRDLMSLRHPIHRKNLFLISDSEIEVMEVVWREYGHYNEAGIARHVRDNCSEWRASRNSDMGDFHISIKSIFAAFGWVSPEPESSSRSILRSPTATIDDKAIEIVPTSVIASLP